MHHLLALGPAVLVPACGLLWLGGAGAVAMAVGRTIRLADRRSTRPASRSRESRGRPIGFD
ncbi:hypothetical protein [Amnibacterium sp.]|uniref:hypothetical protein n=1 Tax=Amnibacterium sp. TaxID=1872496 RepID=UPI002610E5FA|nr:hypothetical protein [Amnibacterium sp.]